MKTYLDCIPCFFKQALETARIFEADESKQKKILIKLAEMIKGFPLESSPPEMAFYIHKMIKNMIKNKDPYKKIKRKSNKLALEIYPELINIVCQSSDRLFTAVKLAIAGNIIDYGAKNSLNVNEELNKILNNKKIQYNKKLFHYTAFNKKLSKSNFILYIGDNAGEVVFDKLLIEEIKRIAPEKRVYFAVRGGPIINDVLKEDAEICGINKVAKIVSSGSNAPGTILSQCSGPFRKVFDKADMIISKGQGNYETLSGKNNKIFFLLIAKCPIIAKHIGSDLGDYILINNN